MVISWFNGISCNSSISLYLTKWSLYICLLHFEVWLLIVNNYWNSILHISIKNVWYIYLYVSIYFRKENIYRICICFRNISSLRNKYFAGNICKYIYRYSLPRVSCNLQIISIHCNQFNMQNRLVFPHFIYW